MSSEKTKGLQNSEIDNVATVFGSGAAVGDVVEVLDPKGNRFEYKISDLVPFGHKIAIKDIPEGEQVIKYGESIGVASKNIKIGQHVHVQNMESMRGRGDLEGKGGADQ